MKYEPWFQFTKKKKKHILLSDFCDAALNMYDIFAAWPEWLSSYDNQSPDRFVKAADGKESEWAPRYQPGISTGASCDQWQVFTNWWSTGWRSDAWLFHTSLKCGAFLFPPRSKGRTRQFSSVGGREGGNRMRYHAAHSKLVRRCI